MSELLAITPVRLAQQICADCGENWDEANFGVRLIMEKSAKAHLDALAKLITPASSPMAEDYERAIAEMEALSPDTSDYICYVNAQQIRERAQAISRQRGEEHHG